MAYEGSCSKDTCNTISMTIYHRDAVFFFFTTTNFFHF